jgi:hypothetical protein
MPTELLQLAHLDANITCRSQSGQAWVTITLPRLSGLAAKRATAATLTPVLIPPKMHSSLAKRRARLRSSSSVQTKPLLFRAVHLDDHGVLHNDHDLAIAVADHR